MRAAKQGLLMALVGLTSAAANAGTVHHVRFAQPAQILVWEHGDLIARGDQIQLSSDATVISNNLAGAGLLVPVSDMPESRKIISVASNHGFSLKSRSANADQRLSVRVLSAARNAQARETIPAAPDVLFQQATKTAMQRGTPESQAIELEITWTGTGSPDLYLIAD